MSLANEYKVKAILTTPQAIKDTIEGFSSIGMDESLYCCQRLQTWARWTALQR